MRKLETLHCLKLVRFPSISCFNFKGIYICINMSQNCVRKVQFRRLVFEFSCLIEKCLVIKKGLQKNKGKEEKKREKERGTEKNF